jgi:glycosyltransferase involved in cell wall biosynthesis
VRPVHVLHVITDLDVGGAEMMLARLARAMDSGRFRQSVVSLIAPGAVGAQLAAEGIEVHSLGLSRGRIDPRGVWRLARLLRQQRPDIVQTWLYHADLLGLVAARLAGVRRVVWNLRCSDMDLSRYSRLSAALVRLLAWLSPRPDAVLVNSVAGQRAHQALGYRPRRWEIVPNGTDIARFRPDAQARARIRAELGIAPESFVICLPARFDPMKDHATFIAAASRSAAGHGDARFVLVGRGTDAGNAALRPFLQHLAGAAEIRLLGERADMPALLAAADVVALSSSFGEGFPNVVAEAMACGTPVVSTDVGDAAEIIGDTGLVVRRRDPEAMAAAWQRLRDVGPAARRDMGARARQRISERYALAPIVARYEALYEELACAI